MEEDVEVETLIESSEEFLLDSTEETCINQKKSGKCIDQKRNVAKMKQINKSVENKENVIACLVGKPEHTLLAIQNTEQPKNIGPEENKSDLYVFSDQEGNISNVKNTGKEQHCPHELFGGNAVEELNNIDDVSDQLNHHLLQLMTNDPIKYYLSQQNSYISQQYTESEEYSSDDNRENYIETNNCIDELLEETQIQSSQRLPLSGNKRVPKFNNKAISEVISLQKLMVKSDNNLALLERKLEEAYKENQYRQQQLQDILASQGDPNRSIKDPSYTKCFFKRFGAPYFADDKGFGPPRNKDCRSKLESGELIITSIPKTQFWTRTHKEMLKNAVKESLIEEKSEKIVKDIAKLKNMLEQKTLINSCEKKALLKEIRVKQSELRCLKNKSYESLTLNENANREYDWMKFSLSLFDGLHSPDECKRFWNVYLKPSINKEAWDDFEDAKLLQIVSQLRNQDWDNVARLLGTNRTAFQCFVHFKTRLAKKKDQSTGKWTKEEDAKLIEVINASKIGNFIPWTKISCHFENRSHTQIYNRWVNSLNPELIKGKFSREEDLVIMSGVEVFGISFSELATLMNNRTSAQIRERYERHLVPKKLKIGTWSLDEDEKLLSLVGKHGVQNWAVIAKEMRTRSRTQVRQRYGFIHQMTMSKPGWNVSQVKRKVLKRENKKANRINKLVKGIKKDFEKIQKTFKLSKEETDTFLAEKILELKDRMSKPNFSKGTRKKVIVTEGSQLNETLLDLFKSCYTKSLVKSAKLHNSDFDDKLNELLELANYFGHNLHLPKSEEEVWNNPRLNSVSKCFLSGIINNNLVGSSLKSSFEQSTSSTIVHTTSRKKSIDYTTPDRDDTIIMNDWWHTPPISVTNLNFSELFKRTVFDYSYGMHKDIWDSKVRRSRTIHLGTENFEKQEPPPFRPFLLPPNQFSTLGERSQLLSKTILNRQASEMDVLKNVGIVMSVKEEEEEIADDSDSNDGADVIQNILDHFQDNLLSLFAWPKVLSLTEHGPHSVSSAQCSKVKKEKKSPRNLHKEAESELHNSENLILNEQFDPSVNSQNVSQKEATSKQEQNLENQLPHKEKSRGCKRKMEIKNSVKKRKLGLKNCSTKNIDKKMHQTKRTSKLKFQITKHPEEKTRKDDPVCNGKDSNLGDGLLIHTYSKEAIKRKRRPESDISCELPEKLTNGGFEVDLSLQKTSITE